MDKELKLHPTVDCFCSGSTAVTLVKQVMDSCKFFLVFLAAVAFGQNDRYRILFCDEFDMTYFQGWDLVIGNLGDSRAIMGTRDASNNLTAVQLTVDLKPNLPSMLLLTLIISVGAHTCGFVHNLRAGSFFYFLFLVVPL